MELQEQYDSLSITKALDHYQYVLQRPPEGVQIVDMCKSVLMSLNEDQLYEVLQDLKRQFDSDDWEILTGTDK